MVVQIRVELTEEQRAVWRVVEGRRGKVTRDEVRDWVLASVEVRATSLTDAAPTKAPSIVRKSRVSDPEGLHVNRSFSRDDASVSRMGVRCKACGESLYQGVIISMEDLAKLKGEHTCQ